MLLVWVYPRACGGTPASSSAHTTVSGLSPRLRGNLRLVPDRRHPVRSIPAPAGEPTVPQVVQRNEWVYPRACGGTAVWENIDEGEYGLSPRLRGNQLKTLDTDYVERSIPAPAGEPWTTRLTSYSPPVYPRACGGTTSRTMPTGPLRGLSPRLRGNQL